MGIRKTLLLLVVTYFYSSIFAQGDVLPRSTPEAEGISSKGIINFLDAAAGSEAEFHSFMLLRHGKVVAEGWWNPYRPDLLHTLYSCSKSFTSTAVGFAVTEKLLSENDKVISFFPDELPDSISPYLAQLSVRDLLSMTSGHNYDPTGKVKESKNWVKTFFASSIESIPGTKFLYNTAATYTLSAIVQKVTGEKLLDYLTPRFFEPLGIKGIDWEENLQGINTGGWGLRLKTEDMAKAGQIYLQKGTWSGKQILPAEWIDAATTIKIDQGPSWVPPNYSRDSSDWLQGYCYQFWRCRHNAYRADGAYGQFIVVMPEQDAVFVMTGEAADLQAELNLVWQYLLPAMQTDRLPDDEKSLSILRQKLSSLTLPVPENQSDLSFAEIIRGKFFSIEENNSGIISIGIKFNEEEECNLTLETDKASYDIGFAAGAWLYGETRKAGPSLTADRRSPGIFLSKVAGAYRWKDDRTLELTLRYIESPHTEWMTFKFNDNDLILEITDSLPYTKNLTVLKGKAN